MPAVVVDSNVLIDYKDTSSSRHETAASLVRGVDSGDLPTARVTDYVVLETLNWIHERQRHDIAADLRRRLTDSAGFELVHSAQKDYRRAVELFDDHEQLAFGDATIAAHMERTGIEYLYSFDDGFDRLDWVTRLDPPDDPFA